MPLRITHGVLQLSPKRCCDDADIHPQARTTPAVRADIAALPGPLVSWRSATGSAMRWCANDASGEKMRSRIAQAGQSAFAGARARRSAPSSVRSGGRASFALDDLTFVLRHFLPHLNRDSIYQVLKAEGLNRRPPAPTPATHTCPRTGPLNRPSEAQAAPERAPFLLSHGAPRVDCRCVISELSSSEWLCWRDAPRECGPHETTCNRFDRFFGESCKAPCVIRNGTVYQIPTMCRNQTARVSAISSR